MTSINAFGRTLTNARNSENGIIEGGFSPELYSVVNGAYTSNAVYGSYSPLLDSYLTRQLPRGTTSVSIGGAGAPFATSSTACQYRQQGNRVDFVCNVTLGGLDPDFLDNRELRIKAADRVLYNSTIKQKALPLANPTTGILPLFEDVEILNKSGAEAAPEGLGTADYKVLARLLLNGDLALVLRDSEQGPPPVHRGLQNGDIDGAFAADNIISITIRGSYTCGAHGLDVRQKNLV